MNIKRCFNKPFLIAYAWLASFNELWWDASSWERKSKHQWTKEFKTHHKVYPFWLSVYLFYWFHIWNTQAFFFTYSQFQPTSFLFLSNAPSLTALIRCSLSLSLSLSSPYSPFCFHLLPFYINTLTILYALSLYKLDWLNTVFH